ncbi:hypothetical protein AB0O20_16315 [Streptomyces kronopolitis]|uniref:hypothetical protein n=1 Tax=Streptomyces kronopolitis TaxID=1612435 RepID=UPI00342B7567
MSLHDLVVLLGTAFGPAEFPVGHEYGALTRRTTPDALPDTADLNALRHATLRPGQPGRSDD